MVEESGNIYVNVDKKGATIVEREKRLKAIDFLGDETIEVKEL